MKKNSKMIRWRYLPFHLVLIFGFFILFWRLFELTIIKGSYYRQLSEGNRVQEKNIRAPRGIIYDRKEQVLARNKPVYKFRIPAFAKASADRQNSEFRTITREEALRLEAEGGTVAAGLAMDLTREYPWGPLLAHVLGYTGEITDEEIRNSKFETRNYKMGDLVGRTGVEEQYEKILRGVDGKELIEVDAQGEAIRKLGELKAKPGENLTLALDLDLQKIAVEALGEKTGVVIASLPATGEILVLFSSPSFDPNLFTQVSRELHLEGGNEVAPREMAILTDERKPLFNRAIGGLYPPGSTFKIITAAAGLESGKINKTTLVEDIGEIAIGPYRFPNWYWRQYGGRDGSVDVIKALKRSNDIFFYRVGEWVGISQLADWAKKFGLAKVLGIDLPAEAEGVMPTPEWRQKTRGEDWFLGDTYHVAIGQGDLQVTPLQVNFWTNVIANEGKLCQPHLIKDTSDGGRQARSARHDSSEVEELGKTCKGIRLKKETIDLIKEGMKQACQPGGTGWPLFEFRIQSSEFGEKKIPVACKTGTAEYGDPKGKTHAWFTVFAPAEEPEITVTVLVEGGGEGSSVAAPIAKKILEEWFRR